MLNHTHQRYNAPSRRAGARRHSRGFSIVELLVGVAIGLFILTGASLLYVNNLGNSRLLLIQARMDQDLRSAMDLITRDLRRGAYWVNSLSGTNTTGATTTANPYANVSLAGTASAPVVTYRYANSTDDSSGTVNNRTFEFKLDTDHAIKMKLGASGTPQSLTDTNIQNITGLTIAEDTTTIDIRASCATTCTGSSCPTVAVRTFNITLTGTSVADPSMTRTLRSQVRVRNDAMSGVCPT